MLKNSFLNLAGMGVPLVAALVAVPILIDELGVDKFGFLTLLWAVSSYLSLFDLGIGRALTKSVSEHLHNQRRDLGGLVWSAMYSMAAISGLVVLLGAVGVAFGDWTDEEHWALVCMVLVVPFVIVTTGLRGVLEAFGEFYIINKIRIPMGIYSFLSPVAVLAVGGGLAAISFALLAGRVISMLVHTHYVFYICSELREKERWDYLHTKQLLLTGGWISISNIISPLMSYADRFIIGAVVSLAAVAYYVTPYEMISKLWIIPGAITAVVFPGFAKLKGNQVGIKNVLKKSSALIFVCVFPVCLVTFIFSKQGLTLWLGADFANNSWWILQFLCVGIFINCMTHVPFTYLQACGHAKQAAQVHLFEVVVYVPSLFLMANEYGLVGAVWVWLIRVIVDAAFMLVISLIKISNSRQATPT